MKIKTKLTLGVGLLFVMILILSLVGTGYINALKYDTEKILTANYNSLEYTRFMLSSLEDINAQSNIIFEHNLQKQELNITETGEKEETQFIRNNFEKYMHNKPDSILIPLIRKGIYNLMDLNMQAIQRKSIIAESTAESATFWIAVTGTLCFSIAFILLINLPSTIANPIKEISQSIKQISEQNYSERLHFESNDEFGELAKSFNSMAEKLEEYNNSNLSTLMIEKKRIEALINNMHDPVIGIDENFKIIFINEEAIKISGLNSAKIIGHNAQELAVKNDLIRMIIQNLMDEEGINSIKSKPLKIYSDNKEGYFEKQILHISVIPTGEENKKLIGHVIILRNITEYKELDFAKTNFIATVSHEFKTPIFSIQMSLQLLENEKTGSLNEDQKKLTESIKEDANRLLNITGELLNLTQVESGNIQLNIVASDPQEILRYAIQTTQTQANQKRIQLKISCPDEIPYVMADQEKTAWVITNLISNAIRYSYEDSTIFIDLTSDNSKITISVRDTGQGIAPQYKNKIFERYFRVPGTKKEGTGLGLAISKEFIEAEGGDIQVESELGSGSIFKIRLNIV